MRTINRNRFYKDSRNSIVSGVCAGLAHRTNLPRFVVRLVALLVMCSLPMITIVAYFAAALIWENRY